MDIPLLTKQETYLYMYRHPTICHYFQMIHLEGQPTPFQKLLGIKSMQQCNNLKFVRICKIRPMFLHPQCKPIISSLLTIQYCSFTHYPHPAIQINFTTVLYCSVFLAVTDILHPTCNLTEILLNILTFASKSTTLEYFQFCPSSTVFITESYNVFVGTLISKMTVQWPKHITLPGATHKRLGLLQIYCLLKYISLNIALL